MQLDNNPNTVDDDRWDHIENIQTLQENSEKWESEIYAVCSIINVKSDDNTSTVNFAGVDSYTNKNIFSLVITPRNKAMLVFNQSDFRPSDDNGWNKIYTYLQMCALDAGVNLTMARGSKSKGEFRLVCKRSIKAMKSNHELNNVTINYDGYASYASPLKLRRSKNLEKTKKSRPSTYHSTSTRETYRNKCCKMSIIIKMNKVNDYFFILSEVEIHFTFFTQS